MIIDSMKEQDLVQVAALEKQLFSVPWSEQGFRDTLDMDGVIFLVAREDEVCIGYCGIYLAADEGEITNVAVDPAYRRKGVARALLQQLLQQAKERGASHIVLEVRASNEAARALYEKLGFTACGVRKNFYQKPVEDAWVMALDQ
ncbi:MAG: ribosomal protein S18-alanine N-acetyltransferase [Roseburia sp.]